MGLDPPPPPRPRFESVVVGATGLGETSSGAVIGPPKATVYRFLGVGLTLVCLCVAGLDGGGRPFPAGVGLKARVAPGGGAVAGDRDGDIGDGEIVRPPNDEIEEYDPEEYIVGVVVDENGPVLVFGNPEIDTDCGRIDALIEPGGELVGENASGGEV